MKLHGERAAFRASGVNGLPGAFIYDLRTGAIHRVADNATPVPGGVGNFVSAQEIGVSDSLLAFIGFDERFQQAGLFVESAGELLRVAGKGDVKDGKTIDFVGFAPDAVDKNVLGYTAYFTDGSSAGYLVAVVPEPAAWISLAAGVVLVMGVFARRRVPAGIEVSRLQSWGRCPQCGKQERHGVGPNPCPSIPE